MPRSTLAMAEGVIIPRNNLRSMIVNLSLLTWSSLMAW